MKSSLVPNLAVAILWASIVAACIAPAHSQSEQANQVAVVSIALDAAEPADADFLAVAGAASAFHKAQQLTWDGIETAVLLRELASLSPLPDAILFVLRPERFDVMLHRRILLALQKLDDDPMVDVAFGYLTARDGKALRDLWARTEAVHRQGLTSRVWRSVSVASGMRSRVYPGLRSELHSKAGFHGDTTYLGIVEADPEVREVVARELPRLADAGVISFSGNGDPQGIWLFDGKRNLDRSLHWDYEPQRVGADPESVMPRLLAADLHAVRLASPIVWSGTCHSAATHRVYLEGDIVSTFGRAPVGTVHPMPLTESLGLAILDAGAVALLAPVGPNHGISAMREATFALQNGASLGEVLKSTYDDVVLAARGNLQLDVHGDRGRRAAGEQIMQGGGANRVLIGDPTLRPFAATSDPREVVRVLPGEQGGLVVEVAWAKGFHAHGWDMYGTDREHGAAVPVRLLVDNLLPASTHQVQVAVEATADGKSVPIVLGHAVLEHFRGRRYLHLQANGARSVIEGKELRVRFAVAASADRVGR